jgi:hypothetical protein
MLHTDTQNVAYRYKKGCIQIHKRLHTDTQKVAYRYTKGCIQIHKRLHTDTQKAAYGYRNGCKRIQKQASSLFLLFTRQYCDCPIGVDEMGWACSTHKRNEECLQNFYRNACMKDAAWEIYEQMRK